MDTSREAIVERVQKLARTRANWQAWADYFKEVCLELLDERDALRKKLKALEK